MVGDDKKKWRYFQFLVYPKSAPDGWLDILRDSLGDYAVSPLHSGDSEENEPHYHVIYKHGNSITLDCARQFIPEQVPANGYIEPVIHPTNAQRYLIHLDQKDKEQFQDGENAYLGVADFVGGVAVPIEDDFSAVDPAMIQGTTVRLTGRQAETFLRSRADLPVNTNAARMARQQVYLEGLADIIRGKLEGDSEYIGALLDAVSPYLVSGMSRSQMVSIAYRAKDYLRLPLIQLPGTHEIGAAGYMEFHPDEQELSRIVAETFYRLAE